MCLNIEKKIILLTFLLSLFTTTFASNLEITVYDRELDLPLEGVRVTEIETGSEAYTDFAGKAQLNLLDLERAILLVELIGYESKKQLVTDLSIPLDIYMLMKGVLEGEELVVEVEAIGETDAETGVSTVVEEEVIQAAAKIGFIEDAMSAVKILPGVTYSGGMASNLSIRGSDSNGFSAVMDGMKMNFPYHFGGMVSIFNPNIVESIKFSPGIFSVKHGEATSALLEITTITPDDGFKFNVLTSTSTAESFFQIPLLNNKAGVLAGMRLTFWEPAMRIMGLYADYADDDDLKAQMSSFSTYPYIYDFYFKGFYKPSNSFNWYLNVFSGNDAIGFTIPELPENDKNIEVLPTGDTLFTNNDLVLNTGISFLPTDNLLISYMLGHEIFLLKIDASNGLEGTQIYSEEFKSVNEITDDSTYIDLDLQEMDIINETFDTQTRLDLDWSLKDNIIIQTGIGTSIAKFNSRSKGYTTYFAENKDSEILTFKQRDFDYEKDGGDRISTFGYFNFNSDISKNINIETGCRFDHFFMDVDYEDVKDINTDITPAPRARLTFSPELKSNLFTSNSFSIGVGMFNVAPWKSGLTNIPEKSLMSVVGWDTHLPLDLHFKIEGYYKYIYDRTYYNIPKYDDLDLDSIKHSDGFGHIAGGDLLVERKISRYIDGMLSYTFVWARYMDPTSNDGYEHDQNSEAPRGEYYWPDFHRFHSFNLLFNVKPSNNFTVTTKFSLASGLPKRTYQETMVNNIVEKDGLLVPIEMYDSKNIYSDSNRADIEIPLDVKFVWHNYLKESKYNWEFYIGVENVLGPLLTKLNSNPNEHSSLLKGRADNKDNSFNPIIPSIGFKLTF